MFLKIKQETSRWPNWVDDNEDKCHQYIEDYQTKESITLEADKIQKNPGWRSLAKIMLNSFRGKYSQQGNKSEVEAISSPARLYQLLNDDSQELQTLHIMNNEMIEVVYKHIQDADPIQVNRDLKIWGRRLFLGCHGI